uniref:BHLH domain-containing protein n=1 Tax=Cyprinus carpio TaxID=7962 RepID=A0A8C2D3L8_CYPCA
EELQPVQIRLTLNREMYNGINSSIEQLKCLLAPEFLKQQPDSKLEKADILEMTLNFLQFTCCQSRLLQVSQDLTNTQGSPHTSGYLHTGKLQTSCEQNRRKSVLPDQKTFSKDMNVNKSAIWRP